MRDIKYHKQEHLYQKGDPTKRGSCYPTVIACLLGIELHQVPYFHLMYWTEEERINFTNVFKDKYLKGKEHNDADKNEQSNFNHNLSITLNLWDIVLNAWLASQGYRLTFIKDIDKWLEENPNEYYLAYGTSARDIGHVVIYQNGSMVHDPHPSNEGLVTLDEYPFFYLKKI